MKQISPVHFVSALFQAIAPNALRMRRHTERRGVLSVPMPLKFIASKCTVHTPEAQSKRCQCAGRNDSTDASFGASTAPSSAAISTPSEANSVDVEHICADLPRSADDAPNASNLSSKDRASGSSSPFPARLDTKPQHASTKTGWPLPWNGAVPSEIVLQENQRTQNEMRTKYPKDVQDSDGYEQATDECRP